MQKSLGFVAVIKGAVAGELDPKCAVDLCVNENQSLDSKRVVSTGGQGGSLEQTRVKMKGYGRDERRRQRQRQQKKREPVCL